MKDINPNPKLNKIFAGFMGALALFFFHLAYDTSTLVESTQWGFEWGMVAVLAGIGGLLGVYAFRFWFGAPINAAWVQFRSGGFRLETKQVFRGRKVFDLDWADITTVTLRDEHRFGGRSIHVAHGRAGAVAWFSSAWTECPPHETLDRLQSSAEAAGYRFDKVAGTSLRFSLKTVVHSEETWTVTKAA